MQAWDEHALTFAPTGQACARFRFDGLLQPATELVEDDFDLESGEDDVDVLEGMSIRDGLSDDVE